MVQWLGRIKPQSATHWLVFIFSIVVCLVGIEHAVGEILQGDVIADEIIIESWPDNELFSIMAGEPAMTVIPNMRVTGIVAVVMSVISPHLCADQFLGDQDVPASLSIDERHTPGPGDERHHHHTQKGREIPEWIEQAVEQAPKHSVEY